MKPDYEGLWHNFIERLKEVRDEYPAELGDWKLVPFKNYSKETVAWVIQCMEESENNILNYKKPACPNCDCVLDYHEWNCVVDGQETGETYKVLACPSCGHIEDVE